VAAVVAVPQTAVAAAVAVVVDWGGRITFL
jgi:hypothetical protein